jgi:stage II sporulation protein D
MYGKPYKWPVIIVSRSTNATLFSSKKKYNLCSPTSFKKIVLEEKIQALFSHQCLPLCDATVGPIEDLFTHKKKSSPLIRVLIAQAERTQPMLWKYLSPHGFFISIENQAGKTVKKLQAPSCMIRIKRGFLWINGQRISSACRLRIRPLDGYALYNDVAYDGEFLITQDKNNCMCVNQLALEDYVCAVLRTESWPGWPLEVNKAFAIACRTYAMFKLLEAQRGKHFYHVKNSNVHQTYRGKHEIPLLKLAVEQTKGMVLGFKGRPILAMFDSCCGSIIPADIHDFDFRKAPYLARTYACHFCNQASLYSWHVSYERTLFEQLLGQHMSQLKSISNIQVSKKDAAGLVLEVTVSGSGTAMIFSGKKLYSLLEQVKSFYFDIRYKSDKIQFMGRGFGHHLGLCQWGARSMVSEGWDYKSILRFYYPGAYFMHLI